MPRCSRRAKFPMLPKYLKHKPGGWLVLPCILPAYMSLISMTYQHVQCLFARCLASARV